MNALTENKEKITPAVTEWMMHCCTNIGAKVAAAWMKKSLCDTTESSGIHVRFEIKKAKDDNEQIGNIFSH